MDQGIVVVVVVVAAGGGSTDIVAIDNDLVNSLVIVMMTA